MGFDDRSGDTKAYAVRDAQSAGHHSWDIRGDTRIDGRSEPAQIHVDSKTPRLVHRARGFDESRLGLCRIALRADPARGYRSGDERSGLRLEPACVVSAIQTVRRLDWQWIPRRGSRFPGRRVRCDAAPGPRRDLERYSEDFRPVCNWYRVLRRPR